MFYSLHFTVNTKTTSCNAIWLENRPHSIFCLYCNFQNVYTGEAGEPSWRL